MTRGAPASTPVRARGSGRPARRDAAGRGIGRGAWTAILAVVSVAGALLAGPTEAPAQDPAAAPGGAFPQEAVPPGPSVIPDPGQFEATAPTDDPELEAQVQKLARQLRCPTCQALSIADSPSELAREMEGVIRMRLQEGMTPEEVRASFVDAYGEWVLLSPDPSGFNLLAYILPLGVLLLGSGIVVVGIRRWLPEETSDADGEPSDERGDRPHDAPAASGEPRVGAGAPPTE